jgi:hypothetical protein
MGLVVLFATTIGHTRAYAQDAEAAAEGLFQDAVELRESGQWEEACEKFQASQKLSPARGTLLNIAECYERFGELARAWAAYRRLEAQSLDAKDTERVAIARDRIRVLEPKLPRVVMRLAPDAQLAGLELRLDDARVDASLQGVGVPVDAGTHTVTATAPGHFGWNTVVEVSATGSTTVEIPRLRSVEVRVKKIQRRKLLAGAVAAAGVLSLAASGVYGIRANSLWNDSQSFCDDETCSPEGLALIDDAKSKARVANIAGAVGLGAIVVSVVVWLTKPSLGETDRRGATSFAPTFGRKTAGIAVSGWF